MFSRNPVLLAVAGLGLYPVRGALVPRAATTPRLSQDGRASAGAPTFRPGKTTGRDMVDERADKSFPASDPPAPTDPPGAQPHPKTPR